MDAVYASVCSESMNYCKFRLAADIFDEMKLAAVDIYDETIVRLQVSEKVDLENSEILKKLRGMAVPAAV